MNLCLYAVCVVASIALGGAEVATCAADNMDSAACSNIEASSLLQRTTPAKKADKEKSDKKVKKADKDQKLDGKKDKKDKTGKEAKAGAKDKKAASALQVSADADPCGAFKGFSVELHSCESNHGDVCRKDDKSGNWMPPQGCKRSGGGAPFSIMDNGSESPCRVAVPQAGCQPGFAFECGSLPHGDVCRKDDDSGNWNPPKGCERNGGVAPWSVLKGTKETCIEISDTTCDTGYHFEAGSLPHGDVCRKTDDSGNWHPPTGCERSNPQGQYPFSVNAGTQNPCRVQI